MPAPPPPADRRPAALLVDLDDTIVSDSFRAADNWRAAIEAAIPDRTVLHGSLDGLVSAVEKERAWFWSDPERHRTGRADLVEARRTIVRAAVRSAGEDEALVEPIAQAYTTRTEEDRKLLPGAIEGLEAIRSVGVRLALVTNGAEAAQQAKIERFDLGRLFDVVVIEGAFGSGKPEPGVYRHALAGLAAEPSAAWMVGDHLEWDVAAPQRLGLLGVWLDLGGRGLPDGAVASPDLIVPDLPTLARVIAALPA